VVHANWITNRALLSAMVLGMSLTGCGDDSSPDENGADGGDAGQAPSEAGSQMGSDAGTSNPGSDDAKVGTFTLRLVAPVSASGSTPATPGYTALSGKVFSGPSPEAVVWEVDIEQGGCELLVPRVPFCDPSCGQDVCVEDDVCKPHPKGASAGTVTISGLKNSEGASSEVKIEPIAASYSTPADVKLSYPPFEEGAEVKLNAKGAEAAAFDITSHGIAPLELTTTNFGLKSGSAFALAWKAPAKGDSRIQIKLDISHHGGTKGKVECDVPDNGSLSISAELITRLLKLGFAGFPTVVVGRVSSATARIATGAVEFKVVSEIEQGVQIDGLTSCSDNADCPMGKTCQVDLSCSK
jgi:hypothetical protein